MLYETQEWGQEYRDAAGERADMGQHLYTEAQVVWAIQRGGAVEIGGRFFETVGSFLTYADSL